MCKKDHKIRRCAHFGRNKCNECDETEVDAETCDVLAQKQRRDKERNAAEAKSAEFKTPEESHDQ